MTKTFTKDAPTCHRWFASHNQGMMNAVAYCTCFVGRVSIQPQLTSVLCFVVQFIMTYVGDGDSERT